MQTRAVCQRLADDPSVNAARREQWKKSAQDAESLLKYSMRKQESIEEERDELVALLVGGERPRKKGESCVMEDTVQHNMFHFSAVRSLKESCMSVVTTAVVHQKANPDKLFAKLPDYIPSRLRRAITDRFQVYAKYIL